MMAPEFESWTALHEASRKLRDLHEQWARTADEVEKLLAQLRESGELAGYFEWEEAMYTKRDGG